jgi:hypothetical protein
VLDVRVDREGPTPERSVSWIPGAEGAPSDFAWRWLWDVEWPAGGAILMAWWRVSWDLGAWLQWQDEKARAISGCPKVSKSLP